MNVKKMGILLSIFLFVVNLLGCSAETTKPTNATDASGGKAGGKLRVAYNAQPPTLDPNMSLAVSTKDVAKNIFETLVTVNSKFEAVPMLAQSIEQSKDGKAYTFHLRKGVKFHNGKEMTAEDVVASMNRWLDKSTLAKNSLNGASFEAKDGYDVVMQLKEPTSLALSILATTKQFPGIMPKEIIESADKTGVKEYIGTGPFKFVEWKKDQYIHLSKYPQYQPVDTPADGLSGKKEALVDDLYFDLVNDPSTRLAGLLTGQYDVSMSLPFDNFAQLTGNRDLQVSADKIALLGLTFNKKQGLFTNLKMRQAINAALDLEKLTLAAFSNEKFYRLDPSYMPQEIGNWHSKAGKEMYNTKDPEKAKRLLLEAGYKGEKIKLLTNRDYEYFYNTSVAVKDQLEKIGMNVELTVTDLATSFEMRNNPAKWELFIGGYTYVGTPMEYEFLKTDTIGWTDDPKIANLLRAIYTSPSIEEAKKHWDELQGYAWEYLPIVKIADYSTLTARSNKLTGYKYFDGPVLWNTKILK